MLYVAYGSNMNLDQMEYRCPKSVVVGVGILKGWKLEFNYHANVYRSDDMHDEVPVLVWDIDDSEWSWLDSYEGFPYYYYKDTVDVWVDGKRKKAIVYVMTDNGMDKKLRSHNTVLPSQSYFSCIEEGYIANGIDTEYLYKVLAENIKVNEELKREGVVR